MKISNRKYIEDKIERQTDNQTDRQALGDERLDKLETIAMNRKCAENLHLEDIVLRSHKNRRISLLSFILIYCNLKYSFMFTFCLVF